MYSFTIAIGKRLLDEGRTDDVIRMIDPLLEDVDEHTHAPSAERNKILAVICLRARIAVLHERRPEYAIALLDPHVPSPIVHFDDLHEALAALWLGWALALVQASSGDLPRSIYLLDKAGAYFERLHRSDYVLWSLLGRATACERMGLQMAGAALIDKAGAYLGFRDPLATDEYLRLRALYASGDGYAAHPALAEDTESYVSQRMQATAQAAFRAAQSPAPMLILGERGCGKSMFAARIHALSGEGSDSFKKIDCRDVQAGRPGPIDVDLLERLLGQPQGSSLFFHHIDALPVACQHVLSRILRGDARPSVRIIASSSEDLEHRVLNERFDAPLLFSLRVNAIEIPPLRHRPEDIAPLTLRFMQEFTPTGAPLVAITEEALDSLCMYDWPGNVRQLRNEIERILVNIGLEPLPVIHSRALAAGIRAARRRAQTTPVSEADLDGPLEDILADAERRIIEKVLVANDGQVTSAADSLGLTRQGLYKKIKRLGIIVSRFQSAKSKKTA